MKKIIKIIKDATLFHGLSEKELKSIASHMTSHSHESGDTVISASDLGDALHIIAEGEVKVILLDRTGHEIMLIRMGPGQFFGEMSLLDNEPRAAYVTCMLPTMLLRLPRIDFQKALHKYPIISSNLMRELSFRLRRANDMISNLANIDLRGRVVRCLIDMVEEYGEEVAEGVIASIKPAPKQIASLISTRTDTVDTETVRRILKELKKDGMVEQRGDDFLVRYKSRNFLSAQELGEYIKLTNEEKEAIGKLKDSFPMKITRHYAELIRDKEPDDPLRKMVIPSLQELVIRSDDEQTDVHADEAKYQPVEGIIHRYPGKLLLLPTLACLSHCRFCFRSGQRVKALTMKKLNIAIDYIRKKKSVRDVVLTGGDPLTLSLSKLEKILSSLRTIKHVQIIRIGTRALAFTPQIIDERFVEMLAKYKPIVMILSFMHPREITPKCCKSLERLSNAGIVLLQQGPLLKGINDDPKVLKELYEKLAQHSVIAYYGIYGIHAPGVRHFVIDRNEARKIVTRMENKTSGFCIPHLITLDQSENKTRSLN